MDDSRSAIQPKKLQKLQQDLIDIYSPSGKEKEILDFVYEYLKRHDLPVACQAVDDSRYNLLVIPQEAEVEFALVGHLDTVEAFELENYCYKKKGDTVSGLGSADMKSGCAAMIESYLTAWKEKPSQVPAALALVVGEEEEGDGAMQLVKEYHFPWAIIGEPTDLRPCLSHYGYVELQIMIHGKRIHASLSNRKQNPVEAMLRLLIEFSNYMEDKRIGLVYNIRDIFSPPAGFIVPDRCEVWIDTHLPHRSPIGEVTMELEEIIKKNQQNNPYLDMTLRFTAIHAGYDIPERGPLVKALIELYNHHSLPWETQSFRSHSDANILWEAGIKPIILGPGQLDQAHAPDESVSFEQVYLAAKIYHDLMTGIYP